MSPRERLINACVTCRRPTYRCTATGHCCNCVPADVWPMRDLTKRDAVAFAHWWNMHTESQDFTADRDPDHKRFWMVKRSKEQTDAK